MIKRLFGLFAMIVGISLIGICLLHPFFSKDGVFYWKFLLATPLYLMFIYYGNYWFHNYYDMNQIPIEPGNPHIQKARELAQRSISTLHAALNDKKNNCHVKVGLPTKSGSIEHIWCESHSYDGKSIWCTLANQPIDLDEKYLNERFEVDLSQIEDYVIQNGESGIGGYSMMAAAQTLLDRGHKIRPDQLKLLKAQSAYKEWKFTPGIA